MQCHALSVKLKLCHLHCCSGCPTKGLIRTADTATSCQGHLDSSNWPVWAEQPTLYHSVWEDHFHSHHTPQHAFLLTIRHHRPRRGAGVLCKASRSYTEWKWYLQQLGVSDYLWRCGECHCVLLINGLVHLYNVSVFGWIIIIHNAYIHHNESHIMCLFEGII